MGEQADLAADLLNLFHTDGEAEEVTVEDLLDNLATLGLKLTRLAPGDGNPASLEYLARLGALPEQQTRPSAIVRDAALVGSLMVYAASTAELLTVALARLADDRARVTAATDLRGAGEIAREYALAITHAEDAITRANKAHYREAGIFAITDAERTS